MKKIMHTYTIYTKTLVHTLGINTLLIADFVFSLAAPLLVFCNFVKSEILICDYIKMIFCMIYYIISRADLYFKFKRLIKSCIILNGETT